MRSKSYCPSFLWIPDTPVVHAFGVDNWGAENDGVRDSRLL